MQNILLELFCLCGGLHFKRKYRGELRANRFNFGEFGHNVFNLLKFLK